MDVADRTLRSRSGAAAPVVEQDRIRKFIAGDRTVPPQMVANFLRAAAERERAYSYSMQQGAMKLSMDPASADLFAPSGQSGGVPTVGGTYNGSKVLAVRKIK
jgi:hypothetical protein